MEPARRSRLALGLALGSALSGWLGCDSLAGIQQGVLVGDAGADSTTQSEAGADSGVDAHTDQSNGSDAAEGGPTEAGSGDATLDTSGDTGTSDAGEGGGPEGGGVVSCALVAADQRVLTQDGGTIAADELYVYNASQTNVLALAHTNSAPSLAYSFRSDHPGDAPQVVALASPTSPASLSYATRAVNGAATYVLASDQQNNLLLWDWPDSIGIGGSPSIMNESPTPGGQMAATSQGIFYVLADNQGAYVDYEVPPTLPTIIAGNQISTSINGLGDGMRIYRLSDDSESVLFFAADGTLHQNGYAPSSAMMTSTRLYFSGGMIPLEFNADGTNVDVAAAIATPDAGAGVGLYTATVPESQLFTFDPSTALMEVPLSVTPTAQSCFASYPGKLLVLTPTTAGMSLFLVDVATGAVSYSLTGASNLLPTDSAIVNCAVATASVSSSSLTFEVVWTENTGGGPQNLLFAPLQCTVQ